MPTPNLNLDNFMGAPISFRGKKNAKVTEFTRAKTNENSILRKVFQFLSSWDARIKKRYAVDDSAPATS